MGDASLEHGGDTLREDRMGMFTHGAKPQSTVRLGDGAVVSGLEGTGRR